jgi:metallo-beta-lactamase family protein
VRAVEYGVSFAPAADVRACFRDAGHILGAAWIEVWLAAGGNTRRKIVFSGDIGERGRPIMRNPERPDSADVLLIESTYGDREHRSMEETYREFAEVLEDTLVNRHGNVIVPAFAVGRIQEVLYVLCKLVRDGRVRSPRGGLQVFVDSPMGRRATELTLKHHRILDDDTLDVFRGMVGRERGNPPHGGPRIHFTETPEESMAINRIDTGAVIVAASGMCDAGRIKHHLRRRLNRRENTILFTGFQAGGTLGRRLVDGASHVRIFGEDIDVRARIVTVGGLSAHAGQSGLLHWCAALSSPPLATYVVHGEVSAATALRDRLAARPGWASTRVASRRETVAL